MRGRLPTAPASEDPRHRRHRDCQGLKGEQSPVWTTSFSFLAARITVPSKGRFGLDRVSISMREVTILDHSDGDGCPELHPPPFRDRQADSANLPFDFLHCNHGFRSMPHRGWANSVHCGLKINLALGERPLFSAAAAPSPLGACRSWRRPVGRLGGPSFFGRPEHEIGDPRDRKSNLAVTGSASVRC